MLSHLRSIYAVYCLLGWIDQLVESPNLSLMVDSVEMYEFLSKFDGDGITFLMVQWRRDASSEGIIPIRLYLYKYENAVGETGARWYTGQDGFFKLGA